MKKMEAAGWIWPKLSTMAEGRRKINKGALP
jgi:hypothetical protein